MSLVIKITIILMEAAVNTDNIRSARLLLLSKYHVKLEKYREHSIKYNYSDYLIPTR
jgi:hypothetical protein